MARRVSIWIGVIQCREEDLRQSEEERENPCVKNRVGEGKKTSAIRNPMLRRERRLKAEDINLGISSK